ncbi:MAG: DUF1552 domain-containing protein [Planctomycetaceae bacterium]
MKPLPRRLLLRNAGIAISLPMIEGMRPAACRGAEAAAPPKRMVCIGVPFGFDPTAFVPVTAGRDYTPPSHLEHLAGHRNDFTVVSGLSHPNTGGGGHKAEAVMLTGAPYPDYSYNLKNTISVDQAFATRFRGQTRYESFALTTQGPSLSVTANGVSIPAISQPSAVFKKLFLVATPAEMDAELKRIEDGRSMLDFVGESARSLSRRFGESDRQRVEEYLESVRDVERQLAMAREWVNRPKPQAIGGEPRDVADAQQQKARFQLMIDMIHLALVTDSTRAISLMTFGMHHDLSHHGKEPKKLTACREVEVELIQAFGGLLDKLKGSKEGESSLLDSTMVMMTSNLRDGNTHWTYNLPVILAGGGFRHGQHLAFNRPYLDEVNRELTAANGEKVNPVKQIPLMGQNQQPLCNLYTSMLQKAGVAIDRFGSATGPLDGLA